MSVEIVKKLTVAKLVGDVTKALPDSRKDTTPVELARVAGIARGVKTGDGQYGPWKALQGDFVFEVMAGENAGKRSRSGTLFMPDVAMDLVAPAVENLEKGAAVEMAFGITAKNDPSVTIGYSYGCTFLVEPEENDPLENLLAKALPAPKKGK